MPTLTLTATKDSYMAQGAPSQTYGSSTQMSLSYNGYREYPVMGFDFSQLPANAYVTSATLKICAVSNPSGKSAGIVIPVGINCINDFNESNVSYNSYYGAQYSGLLDSFAISANMTLVNSGNWVNFDVSKLVKDRIGFSGFMLSYYESGSNYQQSFATRNYSGGTSAPQLVIEYSIGSRVTINVPIITDYTHNENNQIENPYNATVNVGAYYNKSSESNFNKFLMLFWNPSVVRSDAQIKDASFVARTTSYGTLLSVTSMTFPFSQNVTEANPMLLTQWGNAIQTGTWGASTAETWFSYPFTAPFLGSRGSSNYGVYMVSNTTGANGQWFTSDIYSRNSSNPPYISVTAVIPNQPPAAPVITSPPNNTWINTRTPLVQWIFSDPDPGDYQSQYTIELVNSAYSEVFAGTGWLSGNVRSWQMPAGWITADGNYYIRMMVRDSSGTNSLPGTGTPGDTTFYNIYIGVDTTPPTANGSATTRGINVPVGGTFRVQVTGVSDNVAINKVQFPTWTTVNGQDDLIWYEGINAGGGTWYYDVPIANHGNVEGLYLTDPYIWDVAGNSISTGTIATYVDRTAPAVPTQTNGILYATSNGVTWSAFSDGPASSGLLLTSLILQKWNGSAYVTEPGWAKSVAGLSYNFTGLTPGTLYRWGVQYKDLAGNANPITYTNFTTNTYAVTTIENVVAGGKVYTDRPKIRMKVIDANDATLTDLEIQRSPIPSFTSPSDVTMSGSPQSFSLTAPFASGTTVTHTPSALPAGLSYIRARANDGKDWGQWSTVTNLTIEAAAYPTTIAANDTTISKRTIDDIRAKVNIVRQARGLAVIVWTDSTVKDWTNGAAGTSIRGIHLIELRQAINDIYVALGVAAPTWGVDPIIDTTIDRKGQHWLDLRSAITNI